MNDYELTYKEFLQSLSWSGFLTSYLRRTQEDAVSRIEGGVKTKRRPEVGTGAKAPSVLVNHWHVDHEQHMSYNFSSCAPEPQGGCGTRICSDLTDIKPRRGFEEYNVFSDHEVNLLLNERCCPIKSDHQTYLDVSVNSKVLHRGPTKTEIGKSTRIFSFLEKRDQEAKMLADHIKPYLEKHGSNGLLLENVRSTYRDMDRVVQRLFNLLLY